MRKPAMFAARFATVGLCAALLVAPAPARADDASSTDPIGDFSDGVFLAAATADSSFSPADGCRSTAPSSGSRPPRAAPLSAGPASSFAAG